MPMAETTGTRPLGWYAEQAPEDDDETDEAEEQEDAEREYQRKQRLAKCFRR